MPVALENLRGLTDRQLESAMREIATQKLTLRQKLDVLGDLVRREMPEDRRVKHHNIYLPLRRSMPGWTC